MTTTAQARRDPSGPTGSPEGAPAGRRRRETRTPPAFGRGRPPQRHHRGLRLLGVPVTTLVAVELIALCGLLIAEKKVIVAVIAVAVDVVIVVAVLLRRRTIRVGTWVLLRVAYMLRRRETLVAAAEYAGGRRRDAGDRGAGSPNPGSGDGAIDDVDLSPELDAFFPGMRIWEAGTHDGDRMGVVQWLGTCSATVRIGPPAGIVRSRNTADTMPIEEIIGALDGQDLGLDSVQVLTQTIVGEQDPALTPLLPAATAELYGGRARVRNRSSFVTVRLDPSTASEAIAVRGGGHIGIARVLSAALSRARAAVEHAGLEVEVLDTAAANRAIAESFYHQATPYDPIIRWVESVGHIASTRMAHRSFVVTDLRRPALPEIPVGNVFAYALATQAHPAGPGSWATRTVLRVTCRTPNSLSSATRELRTAARRAGVTMQPLDAVQHLGLRATVPAGGV